MVHREILKVRNAIMRKSQNLLCLFSTENYYSFHNINEWSLNIKGVSIWTLSEKLQIKPSPITLTSLGCNGRQSIFNAIIPRVIAFAFLNSLCRMYASKYLKRESCLKFLTDSLSHHFQNESKSPVQLCKDIPKWEQGKVQSLTQKWKSKKWVKK